MRRSAILLSLHRSSFMIFKQNFEILRDNNANKKPFDVSIIVNDFNVKSAVWFSDSETTYEGARVKNLTSQCELEQTINEPTPLKSRLEV